MNTVNIVGDISGLFVEYFRKFGHKQCTVSDLRSYLKLLDQDKLTDLATRLIKDVGISATSVPQSVNIYFSILYCLYQICYFMFLNYPLIVEST